MSDIIVYTRQSCRVIVRAIRKETTNSPKKSKRNDQRCRLGGIARGATACPSLVNEIRALTHKDLLNVSSVDYYYIFYNKHYNCVQQVELNSGFWKLSRHGRHA